MPVLVAANAVLEERDVVIEEHGADLRSSEAMFTPWACGLHDETVVCDEDRCRDIMPELMVELI